jgi:hypothetical protein
MARPLVIASIVVAVMTALYSATYYCLLDRRFYAFVGADPATGVNVLEARPIYRVRVATRLFEPIHRLDRKLRPEYWEPDRRAPRPRPGTVPKPTVALYP